MKNSQDIWKLVEQFQVLHPRIHHSILGAKKEVEALLQVLTPTETVLYLTVGFWKWKVWLLVATDQQILLLNKGLIFPLRTHSFSYKHLQSFRTKEERGWSKIHLWDGTAAVDLNYCLPTDAERIHAAVKVMKHRQMDTYKQKDTNFRLRNDFRY